MRRVGDDPLEMRIASEVVDIRASEGMAKQGLGEKDDEGYLCVSVNPAQVSNKTYVF